MGRTILLAGVACLVGCASYPAPTDRVATAEATVRAANEVGAQRDPRGTLHLKLAQDEIEQGKRYMQDRDNRHADYVLLRAISDAQLALALAKEQTARTEAQMAIDQVNRLREQTTP